jgi:Fic family protein
MLKGFRLQANRTRTIISKIRELRHTLKGDIRKKLPKIYTTDLLNHLFKFPVTFTAGLEHELHISRTTAGKYLKELEAAKFLKSKKSGKYVLYLNTALLKILLEKPEKPQVGPQK